MLFLMLLALFTLVYGIWMLADFGYSFSEFWDWGFMSMWGSSFTCGCAVTLWIQELRRRRFVRKATEERKNQARQMHR